MRLKSFSRQKAFSMRVSFFVGFLVEAEGLVPVASVGNDGCRATVFQPFAQLGAVVSLVTKKLFRRVVSADQTFRNRAVVRLAAGQEDGKKATFRICNGVYLRIAPAARASNRLFLLAPSITVAGGTNRANGETSSSKAGSSCSSVSSRHRR
jgi:hypothetical protein